MYLLKINHFWEYPEVPWLHEETSMSGSIEDI